MKTNYQLIPSTSFAALAAPLEKLVENISEVRKVKVTITWANLTGTLDALVQLFQRTSPLSEFYLYDDVLSQKTLDTATGTWFFEIPEWMDNDLKVVIDKKNCTGGTFEVSVCLKS